MITTLANTRMSANKTGQNKLESNIGKMCLMNLFDGMQFSLPIFTIFLLGAGMSFTQIGLIVGASYIVALILDIPFSIVADRHSRRSFLLLSNVCFMLLNVIFFFSDSFELFFIGYCFNGLGTAFTSGIAGAFVYDTLLSLGREGEYEKAQSSIAKYRFAGKIVASLAGGYLYYMSPRLPFILQALASFVCVILSLQLREPSREKSISRSFNQIKEGFEYLFRHNTIWNAVIVFSVVDSIYDVLTNYYQPAMELSGIPVVYFGFIYVLVNVFGLLGAGLYPKMRSKIGWRSMMMLYLFANLISSLFFASRMAGLVIFAIALLTFLSASYDIYIGNIVNKIVPSSHRATALSIRSQIFNLFFFVLIYAVSLAVDHGSILAGMLVNTAVIMAALFSFAGKGHKQQSALPFG